MMKNSMKLNHLVILSLCALFFFIGVVMAQATTYYVAKTGNDSNNGTAVGTPFLTIQKCIDVVAAGDTCTVGNGTYAVPDTKASVGLINTSANGTVGSPITLKSTNPLGARITVPAKSTGSWGFYVSRHYWIIDGFDISGGGVNGGAAVTGIGIYANGIIARNNTIREIGAGVCSSSTSGYQGIFVENGVQGTIIENNLIHSVGRLRTGEDGCAAGQNSNDHGIYVASVPVGPLTIRRNVFYDVYRGWPIHIYSPGESITNNLNIYHNTFARKNPLVNPPAGHILLQTRTLTNVNIKNNISYDAHIGMVLCNSASILNATNVTISYNLSNTDIDVLPCRAGITFTNNMIFTNPGIVNGPSNNFMLAAGSAAIDAGTKVGLPFKGTAPDIGAYEFGVGGDIDAPSAPIGLIIH